MGTIKLLPLPRIPLEQRELSVFTRSKIVNGNELYLEWKLKLYLVLSVPEDDDYN